MIERFFNRHKNFKSHNDRSTSVLLVSILTASLASQNAAAQTSSLLRREPTPTLPSWSNNSGQKVAYQNEYLPPNLASPTPMQRYGNQPSVASPPSDVDSSMLGSAFPPFAPRGNENELSGLARASWTFVPPSTTRTLRIHDVVSIRVSEMAQSTAQGTAASRKNLTYDARLNDWLHLVGIDTLKPSPQKNGDQRIGGQESEVYRSDSNMRTREEITFNIAAEIADIRPNGNLVLAAHKDIKLNDNDWEVALSGICRPQDVAPDNVVLSKDILELKVVKTERGHVRDGYSRGWFTRWLARFKAF